MQFYSIIRIVLWGQWGMISFIEWREVSAQILEHFVILSTDTTAHVNTSQKAKKLPTKIICHLGKWSRPLKESSPVHLLPHFAWHLMEAALCFFFFFFPWRSCRNQLPSMPYTSMPSNYSLQHSRVLTVLSYWLLTLSKALNYLFT